MIVIIGESSSGKSTLAKYLMDNFGYKKITTYTTRNPRDYEVDGDDYYFISDQHFEELSKEDYFAETAIYNGWKYGSAKKDYEDNKVIVLTPKGFRAIKRSGIDNIYSVYLKVPRKERLIKCLERGDNIEEAYRRNLSDVGQFDGIEDEVDLIIENNNYSISVKDIADMIIKGMSK